MKKQISQYYLAFSASLLATLTSQSSMAVTLKQEAILTQQQVAVSFFPNKGTGLTNLNAVAPEDPLALNKITPFVSLIKIGGTKGLLNEEAPEPTTAFGALLAVCGLGFLKKLKNRKIK